MEESPEEIIEKNGTVSLNGYLFWTSAKVVKPYILEYLKNAFPNNLIIFEFNKIDMVVLGNNIPLEIQSTQIIKSKRRDSYYIKHSIFEDSIRRQIEDNIENYEKCWFFFDMEYYRYLNETASNISINLDWFAKYVKENKLKVFVAKHDGLIKELIYNDLEFIRKLSNTCNIEHNSDSRILNRNKIKIIDNVLRGYKFIQDEIDEMVNAFNTRNEENRNLDFSNFLRKDTNIRRKTYGFVLSSIGNLDMINNVLNMNSDYDREGKYYGSNIGIFKIYGNTSNGRTQFCDKFDICKYFPGYLRNKEEWNRIKDGQYTDNQLRQIFITKNNREQKSISDY